MDSTPEIVGWLKAVGEPTRFRIIRLCAVSDLSGSDLARVLRQSEPRVAHHLRVLLEAGLLRRARQGQWVQYGLTRSRPAAKFIAMLLDQVDPGDPFLVDERHGAVTSRESRLGRELYGFVAADRTPDDIARALVIGVGHLELLEGLASSGCECTAVAGSRRAAQAARSFVERRGLHARIVSHESAFDASFDAVLVDHLSVPHQALPALLANARKSLSREGRVWLFERYDAADTAGSNAAATAEQPLVRIRRELRDAGFVCRRLTPIEADGEHVLAASAA